jgi:uncharacterized membrane protein
LEFDLKTRQARLWRVLSWGCKQEERLVMNSSVVFFLALGIGLVTGLRSMTGPAVVCWAAHLGWLDLEGSRVAFMGSTPATYAFSAAALGELIADKLPFIPNRTSPGPLFGRAILGALSGAALCVAASRSSAAGALLGGAGGLAGAFAGYRARARSGEEVAPAGLGDRPAGGLGRAWRRPLSGLAILMHRG